MRQKSQVAVEELSEGKPEKDLLYLVNNTSYWTKGDRGSDLYHF